MAGFFSKLFGGSQAGEKAVPTEHMQKIGDYTVFATPRKEGAQYRLAGRIEHEVDGQKMVRSFIRADLFTSENDTVETAFRKAQQIIDQNGPSLFSDGTSERQV